MVIGIDASRANVRERTGTEWYAFHLIRGMVAVNRSIRFVLYLREPPLPDLQNLGPHVAYRVLRWPPRYLWSLMRLSLEMLIRPPTVLFVPAHTMPVVHPTASVITLHDIGFERFPQLYGTGRIGRYRVVGWFLNIIVRLFTLGRYGSSELDYHRWSARFAVHAARHIITVSEFTKSEITRYYGVVPDRISVIYHGLDQSLFRQPSPTEINEQRAKYKLTHPYLVFTGRLEKKKNILTLIEVFKYVKDRLPEYQLVLIGSRGLGWDQAEWFIARHNLGSAIHLLGWQPTATYVPLLAGARAFVFLSEYEGFGMPILEAFAVGTPVVAANRSALPEVCAGAALLVDPSDTRATAQAILRLINDTASVQSLVEQGRRRVQAFKWETAARKTLSVLRSCAAR